MPEKLNPEGHFAPPPPGAPREVAQPLTAETLSDMLARARANERELTPFNPQPAVPMPPPNAEEPPVQIILTDADPKSHQPAASESDSPSRGIPKPIADPGKQITGGFGPSLEAQYFPMDGSELRELALKLMADLANRIDNDLRFHPAIVYPRVRMVVSIAVDGYASDANFTVERTVIHEKTPIEVAQAHDDLEMAFVVREYRREFDEEGNPENPPDRMRDELGLEKPRKQFVQTPTGPMLVDRPGSLGDSF